MAMKTIISDFSALKGKVSFSEKTPDAKVSPKVTPSAAPKPKESDKGLKSGHYRVYTIVISVSCHQRKRFRPYLLKQSMNDLPVHM